jgi:hypothetical protein
MKKHQTTKYYWGIGIENETYMQFEESVIVTGEFIRKNIGCERYSIDYRNCYREGVLNKVLNAVFQKSEHYWVSKMINSHTLDKLDIHYEHRTLPKVKSDGVQGEVPLLPNPKFAGKTILELFLEKQPYNIQSMVTQKTNPMGSVNFDGDTIEFITKYFENRTISDTCEELKATKRLFFEKVNESGILPEKLKYPDYNFGLNMFMSNQEKLVLFNNGTFHFHLTLPTLTESSRIVDYKGFEDTHSNAIYLLQWFEPFFIATLGSPDILGVISKKHGLEEQFALGSMRNAMSRYTGVGTFHKAMPKGKVLTYKVEEFRKLIRFQKEDNIWWRDQIETAMEYELLSDVGLDFNQEKMYQSGFEIRCFDEFPMSYLQEVLLSIVLVCEHSFYLKDVPWAHDSVVWNNLVFNSLKNGYAAELNADEKNELLRVFCLNFSVGDAMQWQTDFDAIVRLDEFFFKVLEVLHHQYKDDNVCLDALYGQKSTKPPKWDNFNEFQIQQHLKQIEPLNEEA